jgi:preprotein translocase subunit SecG
MDPNFVRIICAVIAIALLGVIVLRRKKNADE